MPNRMYERGNAFERRVKTDLETGGYLAIQTRGSKGAFDIAAIPPATVGRATLFIQVKSGKKIVAHKAWNDLYDVATRCRGHAVIADRDGRKIRYRRLYGYHRAGSRHWPAEDFSP